MINITATYTTASNYSVKVEGDAVYAMVTRGSKLWQDLGIDNLVVREHDWDFAPEPEPSTAELITEAVKSKLDELVTAYETALYADITYMGYAFQADEYSQNLIDKTLSCGEVPADFAWKNTANGFVPMTFAELQGFSKAILFRSSPLFKQLAVRKNELVTAEQDTVDPISAIEVITF